MEKKTENKNLIQRKNFISNQIKPKNRKHK